jgi:nuclear transport factor 2 (NTF2) superfamily protein
VTGEEAVRAFIDAFNAEDLDALVATLTEDVEIQGSRGLVEGRDEAREWATRRPSGHLNQRLVLEEVTDYGAHALATVRREWAWRESGQVADTHRIYYVATMRDGLIARWAPFETKTQALEAAGAG